MSETTTEPAAPAAPAPPAEGETTLAEVSAKVDKLAEAVAGLLASDHTTGGGPSPEDRSVAAEVQAELKKLQAAEDRKKRAEAQSGKVAELEAKVKKMAERKPREYRKITRLMGWVTDDDDGK